ncbi:TetR/AcrR family transcriptional regulator [Tersicoccus sp. Bi-70]|uniref:TetR/AcrR family transcriptional regulator n=1 Tax=Tersicoccus sp. Bi-70 TaxID=1897634 RepID=UPI000976B265|nr:TetR/AcrR family transcriptional regulator [Tersicoccus sp. Bi-70]OMH34099.1 TetR family transcriptional regulator [Tersicoccus sp. Bi-70]
MPKVVDHDARRTHLVEATWRIIARRGLERATLREVATAAGFANGALKPYFPTKSHLVEATYRYVFARTNERVAATTRGLDGLDALRAFALEVLPLDEERLDEARVVIPFWQSAVHDEAQARVNATAMEQWRGWIAGWLTVARADRGGGQGVGARDAATDAEALLNFLLGAQISAVLAGSAPTTPLPEQLDALLDALTGSD